MRTDVRWHRILVAGLVAGLTAMTLLAAAPGAAQDGEVALDAWIVDAMGLEEAITRYDEEASGVTVATQSRAYDEHHEALLAAIATSEAPDIAALGPSFSAMFMAHPEDFMDLATLGVERIRDEYLPWRWTQGVAANGSTIGVPSDVGAIAMCYRTDLLSAAGVPTDPDGRASLWPDWRSFIDVGTRFVASIDVAFIDSAYGTIFDPIGHQGRELFYADDGSLIYGTNPRVRQALDTSLAAIEADLSAGLARSTPEWEAALAAGGFAVLACSAGTMDAIQRLAPSTAGAWAVTGIPDGGGASGGMQLVIPAASDHPKEAYDLLAWLLSPDDQREVFERHGVFPSTPELDDLPEVAASTSDFFSGAPVGAILAAATRGAQPRVEGPQQRPIERELEGVLGAVEDGRVAADAAWDTALANIAQAIQG